MQAKVTGSEGQKTAGQTKARAATKPSPSARGRVAAVAAAGGYAEAVAALQPGDGPGGGTWTVKSGDTLSSIAAEVLGDAGRWQEVWRLNRDTVRDPGLIFPGQVLRLPKTGGGSGGEAADAVTRSEPAPGAGASPEAATGPATYVVQPGDTMSEIAARVLGSGAAWRTLWEANRATVPDANLIRPGMVLVVPGRAARESEPAPARPEPARPAPGPSAEPRPAPASPDPAPEAGETFLYTVAPMDSLAYIAKTQLGNESRWREIWELNRAAIPDPSRIRPGMVLKLPGKGPTHSPAPREPVRPERGGSAGGTGQLDPSRLTPIQRVAYNIYKDHHAFLETQASRLGFEVEVAAAVMITESSGSGFNADGSMKIRFEPHIFEGYTGRVVADSHANQAAEYAAFNEAKEIDRDAAYKSISMGAGQVMGFNAATCGYESAEEMFEAFAEGEEVQLGGMFAFVEAHPNLVRAAREHDWHTFARGYNGPAYAKNGYHTKLASYFEAYRSILNMVRDAAP